MSTSDPQELSGVIRRVDHLGSATSQLFSRLYQGLRRGSEAPTSNGSHSSGAPADPPGTPPSDRDVEVERLSAIIHTLDEGIIVQDNEGRVLIENAAAKKLIGSRKDFWTSELGTLFNAFRDVVRLESELAPLGEPARVQINNMIIGAQVAAVADSQGKRIGTMMVLRDVTRDALADRLKDSFVTAISHELRTPMAVIKGMSDVIMGQPQDKPPNRKFLETLSRNV